MLADVRAAESHTAGSLPQSRSHGQRLRLDVKFLE
jgi:hypothetical protein